MSHTRSNLLANAMERKSSPKKRKVEEESGQEDSAATEAPNSAATEAPKKHVQQITTPAQKSCTISLHHLSTTFLKHVLDAELNHEAKVYEVVPAVVIPRTAEQMCSADGRIGSSWLDCYVGVGDADAVGPSTYMLSYSWSYSVGDIVGSLEHFCSSRGLDPKRTYFWIDFLCVNQHRVREVQANNAVVPMEVLQATFRAQVEGAGKVVAIMSPWREPRYPGRVWCDFEMFTAINLGEQCEVFVAMPPREEADMIEALISGDGVADIWRMLGNLRVQDAQATVESDRLAILRLIEEGPGFHHVNSTVAKFLQCWVVETCDKFLRQQQKDDTAAGNTPRDRSAMVRHLRLRMEVGNMQREIGSIAKSAQTLQKAKAMAEEAELVETALGADLFKELGVTLRMHQDSEGAQACFREQRRVMEIIGTLASEEGIVLVRDLGWTLFCQDDPEKALGYMIDARKVAEAASLMHTAQAAILLSATGSTLTALLRFPEAALAHEEAVRGIELAGDLITPMGAKLKVELGEALRRGGELDRARDVIQEGIEILEKTSTFDSHKGAEAMRELGAVKRECGDLAGARADLVMATRLLQETESSQTIGGIKTLLETAVLERASLSFPAAIGAFTAAQSLHAKICPSAGNSARAEQIRLFVRETRNESQDYHLRNK